MKSDSTQISVAYCWTPSFTDFFPALSLHSLDYKNQERKKSFVNFLVGLKTWSNILLQELIWSRIVCMNHWKESWSCTTTVCLSLELVLYIDYVQCRIGEGGREGGSTGLFLDFFFLYIFLNVLQNLYLFSVRSTFCYVLYRPKSHSMLTQATLKMWFSPILNF